MAWRGCRAGGGGADEAFPRYALEIRPAHIRRSQFGGYSVWIRWDKPGALQPAFGRCTLVIKPCVRLTGKPALKSWPGGVVFLSLENCGGAGVEVSISISHQGSSWSQGWEFGLDTGDGPFKFEESFEPPADGRGGEFDLEVSAEGISLVGSPPPARGFSGGTYEVAATATSKEPVMITIDPSSTSLCSISGVTVTFSATETGACVIDANQAGNGLYLPAPQVQQVVKVHSRPPSTATATPVRVG